LIKKKKKQEKYCLNLRIQPINHKNIKVDKASMKKDEKDRTFFSFRIAMHYCSVPIKREGKKIGEKECMTSVESKSIRVPKVLNSRRRCPLNNFGSKFLNYWYLYSILIFKIFACFLKYFYLKIYWNNIFLYFFKFIFNINILK